MAKAKELPKARGTGGFRSRYHATSNPPPSLNGILHVLRKRADDNGRLDEKPTDAIHGLKAYRNEGRGPADDASRFLFSTGCVITLDDGTYLLDEQRFREVMGCCENGTEPSRIPDPDQRIRDLLGNRGSKDQGKTQATVTICAPREPKNELSKPDSNKTTSPAAIATPTPLAMPGHGVGSDVLITMLLPVLQADIDGLERAFGPVIQKLPKGLPQLIKLLRLLIEDQTGEEVTRVAKHEVTAPLAMILRQIQAILEENGRLRQETGEFKDTKDQVELLIEALQKLLYHMESVEAMFDRGVVEVNGHRTALEKWVSEDQQLREDIKQARSLIAAFCREVEALTDDQISDPDQAKEWQDRVTQVEREWSELQEKNARRAEIIGAINDRQNFISFTISDLREPCEQHATLVRKMRQWRALFDEAVIDFKGIDNLDQRLSQNPRDLGNELNSLYRDAEAPAVLLDLTADGSRLAATLAKVKATTQLVAYAFPEGWSDGQILAVKRLVISAQASMTERTVRGRTIRVLAEHILKQAGLALALPWEKAQKLAEAVTHGENALFIATEYYRNLCFRLTDLGHKMADLWTRELKVSKETIERMRELMRERNRLYSQFRQTVAKKKK